MTQIVKVTLAREALKHIGYRSYKSSYMGCYSKFQPLKQDKYADGMYI